MIKVYSKNSCPFCVKAKAALDDWGIEYQEVNVDLDHKARFRLRQEGLRTVPQIFLSDDTLVEGGCDGLLRLGKTGLTERMEKSQIDVNDLGGI